MRGGLATALGIAAVVGLGGHGFAWSAGSPPEDTTPTDEETTTMADAERTMSNPVLDADFPDPFILEVDGEYWAYSTGAAGWYIQVARSADLVDWEFVDDALPSLPDWQSPGFTWAPEVAATPTGYVMYYTTRDRESGRQCVSVAVSDDPRGTVHRRVGRAARLPGRARRLDRRHLLHGRRRRDVSDLEERRQLLRTTDRVLGPAAQRRRACR